MILWKTLVGSLVPYHSNEWYETEKNLWAKLGENLARTVNGL